MTIGQTVGEGLRILGNQGTGERAERLAMLLKMVGMSPGSADRYPHEFSGGQRQRIGIARALSVEPSLIICDEPISALDVSIQAQIINLLKDLQDQLGLSYLFISHDLNVVGYLCTTIAVMYKGQIMEIAPAEKLFKNPRHPYTLSLLAAIPEPEPDKKQELKHPTIDFSESLSLQTGCPFQQSCSLEELRCQEDKIHFERVGEKHLVRCWKAV
jgi:oligopeptide/dipeptide ABC transporter ATP-binding protein